MSETYKQIVGGNPKRLEALSDGVFAIAMTLLVLDLRVPLRDEIHSELELFHSFLALAPRLLSYLLGMITLGIYWTGNATLLGLIDRSERNFTWITIFFLLTISLIPFSTAFLGEFIDFKFAVGIYGLNLVLLGWCRTRAGPMPKGTAWSGWPVRRERPCAAPCAAASW